MSKKLIIITAVGGLLSFTGAFLFSWITAKPALEPQAQKTVQALSTEYETPSMSPQVDSEDESKRAMTQRQLKGLIKNVREKIDEYNDRLRTLEAKEERFKITQQNLKEDLDELTNLQAELATMVAKLKEERDRLLKTRIKIEESEKENLMSVAATYDKMAPASAGQIFANMSQMNVGDTVGLDDAVKIMYYMNDRNKAKVLAELVNTEPKLAAVLSQRLKKIAD